MRRFFNSNRWRQSPFLVLMFYLCFFLLTSSGRLASGDAGNQLQASMLLANTGSLGTTIRPIDDGLWVRNSQGRYYEAHDIGNPLFMYPAALVGSVFSRGTVAAKFENPPIISRVAVALMYSVLSAAACFFLFRLFRSYYGFRRAFLLSFIFASATIFWPYTKSAWDVLGAACFVCALLYFSNNILSGNDLISNSVYVGLSAALTGSFRYSLAPFLVLSVVLVFYYAGQKLRWQHWALCATSFFIGMLPTLFYNYIRMGSPFKPATMAEKYVIAGTADLSGSIAQGFFGLTMSPNKGMLTFSPIFILLFFLPFVWKKVPMRAQQMCISFGTGAALHILLLSKVRGWGTFGWGPRYLVSVLPILFFMAAAAYVCLWEKYKRPLVCLTVVSSLLCFAPSVVNWHLAVSEYPQASNPSALLPYQHLAVWHGLLLGLQGKPLPAPAAVLADPIRSASTKFPDLWTVRLMERSPLGFIIGLSILLLLLTMAGLSFWRIVKPSNGRNSLQMPFSEL